MAVPRSVTLRLHLPVKAAWLVSWIGLHRKHLAMRLTTCVALALAVQVVSAQNFSLPELNLPRLEPLDLGSFNLSQNQGPVNFKADFKDLLVSGLGRINFGYLDVNHENLTVAVGVTVPALTIRGKYNINGTVFQLPVEGTGPFLALLEGIVAEGFAVMKGNTGKINSVDSMNFDVKIHKFRSKVENLFGGNELLQNTFTHFIEENSNLVLEQVRPNLVGNLDSLMTGVVNAILSTLPSDVLTTNLDANKLDKHRARTLRIQAQSRNL